MYRVMTDGEELESRRKSFEQLHNGSIFDLGFERYFLACNRKDEDSWLVIELEEENIGRIICGQWAEIRTLRFEDMKCLNVRS